MTNVGQLFGKITMQPLNFGRSQPQPAPLPSSLKRSMSNAARFITYVEDDPFEWCGSFDHLDEAIQSMRWFVSQRLAVTGSGFGAVLDDERHSIVAVDQMEMPTHDSMAEAVHHIRSRLR